ncbi:hypothetical protein ACFLRQ_00430 [Bacteroidota bacterium]
MKKLLILFAAMLISITALSQDRSKFLYAEFADQSSTLWPFYKPFGCNFDPAITLGAGMDYKQKGNLTLFQTLQLTGYSTPITGQGFHLTSSFGYRYDHSSGLFGEGMLGLGTSLFFSSRQVYTQDDNGEYAAANPLHIVAALPLDLIIGYGKGKLSVYVKYRYMAIGPYTEVLTVLPSSLLGLGVRYYLTEQVNN